MKVLRNVLGACAMTLTFSGSAFAGIMHTGCQSSDSTALAFEVTLNLVQGIIALL